MYHRLCGCSLPSPHLPLTQKPLRGTLFYDTAMFLTLQIRTFGCTQRRAASNNGIRPGRGSKYCNSLLEEFKALCLLEIYVLLLKPEQVPSQTVLR